MIFKLMNIFELLKRRYTYDYIPSRYYMRYIFEKFSIRPCYLSGIALDYAWGEDIHKIALSKNITRERVRQYLIAFIRNFKQGDYNG